MSASTAYFQRPSPIGTSSPMRTTLASAPSTPSHNSHSNIGTTPPRSPFQLRYDASSTDSSSFSVNYANRVQRTPMMGSSALVAAARGSSPSASTRFVAAASSPSSSSTPYRPHTPTSAAEIYYAPSSSAAAGAVAGSAAIASSSSANSCSAPATPVKRQPLGDATFITQAARTPNASAHCTPVKPMLTKTFSTQYSPVKMPPTPSRKPVTASTSTALIRPHPLQHSRPLLILDLDETLVHASVEQSDGTHDVAFVVELGSQKINVFVKIRPFAREFLRRVASLFEVCVFTASLAPYADRVVDYLDPSRQLVHHRLYREHCTNVDGNYIKDMSLMGRSMERVAIVDNSPVAYTFQPENGIPIVSWFDDRNDKELMEMMPMLEFFAQTGDIFRTSRKFLSSTAQQTSSTTIIRSN